MEKNVIVNALYEQYAKVVKEKRVAQPELEFSFISGSIESCGSDNCFISEHPESVYGFAVYVEDHEKESMYKKLIETNVGVRDKRKYRLANANSVNEWSPLAKSKYYPLYWGKSQCLFKRIIDHTKSAVGVGSLWLHRNQALHGKKVIFGTIPCYFPKEVEESLQKAYKQVLKTHREP